LGFLDGFLIHGIAFLLEDEVHEMDEGMDGWMDEWMDISNLRVSSSSRNNSSRSDSVGSLSFVYLTWLSFLPRANGFLLKLEHATNHVMVFCVDR